MSYGDVSSSDTEAMSTRNLANIEADAFWCWWKPHVAIASPNIRVVRLHMTGELMNRFQNGVSGRSPTRMVREIRRQMSRAP